MDLTKKLMEKLNEFGEIQKIEEQDMEESLYLFKYDIRNLGVKDEIEETNIIPFVVSMDESAIAEIKTYVFDSKILNKKGMIDIVNKVNAQASCAKFYIDDENDICCETIINISKSNKKEIGNSLMELAIGFLKIMVYGIKNETE